jgi:hypothetical protein
MATRKTKKVEPGEDRHKLDRQLLEQLIFGTGRVRRFTQDTPILPDVWIEYARDREDEDARLTRTPDRTDTGDPFPPIKLLLAPLREQSSGTVAQELRRRLREDRTAKEWQAFGHDPRKLPRVVYNQSTVAATLYFEDLIRVALPMTSWWTHLDKQWRIQGLGAPEVREIMAKAVQDPEHPPLVATGEKKGEKRRLPPALLWMIRVVGALALVHRGERLPEPFYARRGAGEAQPGDWRVLVDAVADLIRGVPSDDDFTIHLTYPADEFNVPAIGEKVAAFVAKEKSKGRAYRVETRKPGDLSLRIALA